MDDEPFNIFALACQLESLGIERIDKGLNGLEALEKVRENASNPACPFHQTYRVIFTDKNMPVMDGIQNS